MSGGAEEPPGLSGDNSSSDAVGMNPGEQDSSQLLSYKDIMLKNKVDLKKKEEVVQEYANKLSKIKSRTKLSRRTSDSSTSLDSSSKLDTTLSRVEDDEDVNDISEAKTPKAKSHLLQKKLAENRKIFEQRNKEITESNRAVEERVEAIRQQINETELQKEHISIVPITPISILPQIPSTIDSAQLHEKDNKITELNMRIHELEAIIIDLQDNLKEKDSVIDSKTKAVTLMSEDLSKKGKTTLDTLEETKDEMRAMQQNFVLMETSFKDKHDHLLGQLEEKSNRVIELEEAVDKMESELSKKSADVTDLCATADSSMVNDMRREMTAMQENFILIETSLKDKVNNLIVQLEERERRLAEVENNSLPIERTIDFSKLEQLEESNRVLIEENEKLTKTVENLKIQSDLVLEKDNRIVELEKIVEELREKGSEDVGAVGGDGTVEKLKKELDELNKNMIKLKAQHKSKLRNLNKRLESFKMVSDANAELVKLGNQVALLEEEKGNLQLSLVDFDELKASSVELQGRIRELESKVEAQSADILSHVDAIAALENQKLDLMQELHTVKQEVSALEAENADSENLRVTAELKVVELEEQLESVNKSKSQPEPQSEDLSQKIHQLESENKKLREKLENVESYETIEENRNELLKQVDLLTQKNQNLELQLLEFGEKGPRVEKKSSDTDSNESFERISDNNDDYKKLTISEEKLSESPENVSELHQRIENLVQENGELVIELTKIREKLETTSSKLSNLETENSKLKDNVEKFCDKEALLSLAAEIANCKQMNEKQLQLVENLEMNLVKSEQQLNVKRDEISECQHMIKNLTSIESRYKEMEKFIEERLQVTQLENFELSQKLETQTHENRDSNKVFSDKIVSLELHLIDERAKVEQQNSEIVFLNETLDKKLKMLEELKEENENLKQSIVFLEEAKTAFEEENRHLKNQVEVKDEAMNNLEQEFKTTVGVIEDRLKDKEMMLMSLENQAPALQEAIDEKTMKIEELNEKVVWLQALLQAKDISASETENQVTNLQFSLQEKERMANEFEGNIASMDQLLENKATLVAQLQNEIKSLLETLKANEVTINTLKEQVLVLQSSADEKESAVVTLQSEKSFCQESMIEKDSLFKSCIEDLGEAKSVQQSLEEVENENLILNEKLTALEKELETANSTVDELKENVNAVLEEKSVLVQEVEELKLQKLSLQEAHQELSDELNRIKEENGEFKVKNEDLSNRLESMDKELKEKYNQLLIDGQTIEKLNLEVNSKESVITSLKEQIEELNNTITENDNNVITLEAELMELRRKLTEKDVFEDRNNELSLKVNENEKKITELLQNISELQTKLDESILTINNLQQVISEKENLLFNFSGERESLIHEKEALTTEIEVKTTYAEEMRQELNQAYKMMEQLKLKHVEDTELQNQRLEEIILELNSKTAECSQLTSILEEKEKLIGQNVTVQVKSALEERIATLEQNLADVNNNSQAQIQKMKVIAANLKKKTALCQELEAKATEFEEKWTTERQEKEEISLSLQKMQEDVDEKAKRIKELEEQLISTQKEATDESEAIQRLSEELNMANETIISLQNHVKTLQSDIERLLSEIDAEKAGKESLIQQLEHYKQTTEQFKQFSEAERSSFVEQWENYKQTAEVEKNSLIAELENYKQTNEAEKSSLIQQLEHYKQTTEAERSSLLQQLENYRQISESEKKVLSDALERSNIELTSIQEKMKLMEEQQETMILEVGKKSMELDNEVINNKKFSKELESLELSIKDLQTKLADKDGVISNLKLEFANKTEELETLRLKLAEEEAKKDDLLSEKSETEKKLEEATEKARELGVRMQVMETEYVEQLNTIQTLKTQNGMLLSQHVQLNERMENTEAESNERLRVLESLKNEIIELKNSKNQGASCDHCDRCQGLVDALEGKLQERNAELENLDNELANSIANFLQMRENLRTQEIQVNEESQEARNTLAQYNELLNKNTENEAKIEELNQQIVSLNEENQRKIEELSEKVRNLEVEKEDLILRLQNVESVKTLEPRVEKTQKEELFYQTSASQSDSTPKLFDAAKLFDAPAPWDVEESKEDVSALKKRLSELEVGLATSQEEITRLNLKNEELSKLNRESEDVKRSLWDLEEQIRLLNTENNQLRADLFQRQETMAQSVEDLRFVQEISSSSVAELNKTISSLKSEKEEYLTSIRNFLTNISSLQGSSDISEQISEEINLSEVNDKFAAILSTISVLQSRISGLASQNEEKTPEIAESAAEGHQSGDLSEIKLDDDEEWGWNAQDAELGSGVGITSICTGETQLKARIAELEDTIKDLQEEKSKLNEEIKANQLRSGKLVKKLKEFKLQNDSLQKQLKVQMSSGGLCDLDSAIEDELKGQIAQLEKNLSEIKGNHDKMVLERDSLLKRIDVLVAANERFTEMKERQDREVEVLQIRNNELVNKMQSIGVDPQEQPVTKVETSEVQSSESTEVVPKEKFDELQESLDMLAAENEELQSLIETEKSERLAIELSLTERIREMEETKNQTDEMKISNDETLKKCQNLEKDCIDNLERANQRLAEMESNHEIVLGEALQRAQLLESEVGERNERIRVLEENLAVSQQHLNEAQDTLANVTELLNVRVQEVAELRQQLQVLQTVKNEAESCHVDVQNLNKKLVESEQDVTLKQLEISTLSDKLQSDLNEKSAEIERLEAKIQGLVTERESLVANVESQGQEILSLKEALDKSEWMVEALKTEANVNKETISKIESELSAAKEEIRSLSSSVDALTLEISGKLQQIDEKEKEITSLKEIITNMQQKFDESSQECLKCKQNEEITLEIEKLKEQLKLKEEEVEDFKYILSESTYPKILQGLQEKINVLYDEKVQLEAALAAAQEKQGVSTAQEAIFEEETSAKLSQVEKVLAEREQELEALKKKLESKTTECTLLENALAKQLSSEDQSSTAVRELTSNELDVALYMLHQRDVRCEELTHELMQLLEERDTLQLRLSNAIRLNEEFRRVGPTESKAESEKLPEAEAPAAVPDTEKTELAQKLSQLHTVGHRRDLRLVDDRELRNTQQMSLLAHKDALSTLPPDAAARLINANYTLSRDVQSQSSVLLNWLWGKSTPKVVHM